METYVSALARPCFVEVGTKPIVEADVLSKIVRSKYNMNDIHIVLKQAKRLATNPGRFELLTRCARDFGYSSKIPLQALYNKAEKEGLQKCTPEMIIRFLESPLSEVRLGKAFHVAMEPIYNERGLPEIVHINGVQKPKEGLKPLLCLVTGDPYIDLAVSVQILFARPL